MSNRSLSALDCTRSTATVRTRGETPESNGNNGKFEKPENNGNFEKPENFLGLFAVEFCGEAAKSYRKIDSPDEKKENERELHPKKCTDKKRLNRKELSFLPVF